MFANVFSAYLEGIDGLIIHVEADASPSGMPSFSVVGLAEGALKESKERVKSSLKNLDYNIFACPITINLAPADIKKEGSHFDLPIAISILAATYNLPVENIKDTLFIGELSLDGRLRGVSGVISIVEAAKLANIKNIVLPTENASEASLIGGINIYPFSTLAQVISFVKKEKQVEPYKREDNPYAEVSYEEDFSDIKGQLAVKRAAEIAAAGMHNIILVGTPGSGKTMIARRMTSIMPDMTIDEALRSTKIYSSVGLLKDKGKLITKRPFISPHHTASNIAIIGGGAKSTAGQVSIASGGILFLDEMLEFNRSVLEALRQPLEDKVVTISRARRTVTYPADFMLIGAMNPCPCGYFGDKNRNCSCTQTAIDRYKARLSGPMLDRIDIHLHVQPVHYKDFGSYPEGETSEIIKQRVINAHNIQKERFKGTDTKYNSRMSEKQIKKFCKLNEKCVNILEKGMDKFNLSARAASKIIKTSRTIADLSNKENIEENHILEALQLRCSQL